MLYKLFGARTRKPNTVCHVSPKPVPMEEKSPVLKIIHAGGKAECYYMAVPAAKILEKYPSSVLAKPDVFRKPWESVVLPEEILIPGQKFFIVPRRTMIKLRRRIRKPSSEKSTNSFVSQSSIDVSVETVSQQKDDLSNKSFLQQSDVSTSSIISAKPKGKIKPRNRHVRFLGIDVKRDNESGSVSMEKKGNKEDDVKKSSKSENRDRKRRVRHAVTWHPSLTVISESHGSNE